MRLRRPSEFRAVYREGRRRAGEHFLLFVRCAPPAAQTQAARLGITVTRQAGGAVVRNRIRRRVRALAQRHWAALGAGCDWVVNPRRAVATAEFAVLEAEWQRLVCELRAAGARALEGRERRP